MLGFAVVLVSGEIREIPGETYEVSDDGSVAFAGGGSIVDRLGPGDWIEVTLLGTRLSETWPSQNLALVVDSVAQRLGVHYGHYVHALRDLARFQSWRLNELDDLTTALLVAIGEDPHSTDRPCERSDVRDLIARGFGIST